MLCLVATLLIEHLSSNLLKREACTALPCSSVQVCRLGRRLRLSCGHLPGSVGDLVAGAIFAEPLPANCMGLALLLSDPCEYGCFVFTGLLAMPVLCCVVLFRVMLCCAVPCQPIRESVGTALTSTRYVGQSTARLTCRTVQGNAGELANSHMQNLILYVPELPCVWVSGDAMHGLGFVPGRGVLVWVGACIWRSTFIFDVVMLVICLPHVCHHQSICV